ncbi:MAG: hypothetical protein ACRYFS_00605 [Janthinobacterium lividum]
MMTEITLNNGLTLTLCRQGETFAGIGAVHTGGVPLRSGHQPAFVEIWTPDGVALTDFRVVHQEAGPDGIAITLEAQAQAGRLSEWMLHETRQRLNTEDFVPKTQPAPGTTLQLVIKPVVREIGGQEAAGFVYQYRYHSPEYPIYKILDKATWEVGGAAVENTFWLRNSFAPSIYPITESSQSYSTEWYLPTASNPNIFQFLPWQTTLEGFTMTTHTAGTLITWATEVSHIRSLFEKPAGAGEIRHWHEHCGDLSSDFSTAPLEVLWLPGTRDRVGYLNLYESVRDLVYGTLHEQIGMRRERASSYGVIEEWGVPDIDRYRTLGLPRLHDAGVKAVFLPNEFENNMNVYGVSNMCCTVDYKVAESVGEDKLTAFCQAAHASGIRVEMWGNTALSSLTYIFAMRDHDPQRIDFLPIENSVVEVLSRAKDPWVRNASGAIEADHYTPVFAQLNLRDPDIRAYWMQQWSYAQKTIGLDQIFLDSSFNMSSDKFHWVANPMPASGSGGTIDQTHLLGMARPAAQPPTQILSQYRAHLDLMVEMQEAGYAYCAEDIGVFGIHRTGPSITARLDNLALWSDSLGLFDVPAILAARGDPDAVYFAGLAYRLVWQIFWDIARDELSFHAEGRRNDFDAPGDRHIALLKAYNVVMGAMDIRTILPGEAGVLYADAAGSPRVLWAFEAVDLPLPAGTIVQEVLTGKTIAVCDILAACRQNVYLIAPL